MVRRTFQAVAASLLLHSAVSANAAIRGDDCCGDIKERVAEFETRVARENGILILQINGKLPVSVLLVWDLDDWDDIIYVPDSAPGLIRGCFGKAAMTPSVAAEYKLEFEVQPLSFSLTTEGTNSDNPTYKLSISDNLYFESDRQRRDFLGR
jgi:hypothetical protein